MADEAAVVAALAAAIAFAVVAAEAATPSPAVEPWPVAIAVQG